MRNPFRSLLNMAVAAAATIALGPVVFTSTPAFARGGGRGSGIPNPGGSGGAGGPGGASGGRGSSSGGKGGSKSSKGNAAGTKVKPSEYLILIQEDDSDEHRGDFLVYALDDATIELRDKDRAAALFATREAQSRRLRADDMPRP